MLKLNNTLERVCIVLLILQASINLVGVLGPEHAFDSLWYHLTLPKLYLQNESVTFIQGGLMHYSTMPKLVEMLYAAVLSIGNEIGAKAIHFGFGILTLFILYNISRKFLPKTMALLCVVLFYSNLVVAWQSITAYVDLGRTFFETLAFWAYIMWIEKREKRSFILLGTMLGFSLSTKIIAFQSLFLFFLLFIIDGIKNGKYLETLKNITIVSILSIFIALPWFIFSLFHTGNPFYPLFSNLHPVNTYFTFSFFSEKFTKLFFYSSDPFSPVYFIFLPLIIFYYKKLDRILKAVCLYVLFAILLWFFIPYVGEARYLIPYFPALSLLCIAVLPKIKDKKITYSLIAIILVTSLSSIIYRGVANTKYIPFILGKETKNSFLLTHLNFSYGDFVDSDDYFKKNIKSSDNVLLIGFHNLYYVNFPFVHESWYKGEPITHIALQGQRLPNKYETNWYRIYENKTMHVTLYKRIK